MMKYILSVILVLAVVGCTNTSTQSFSLQGHIEGLQTKMVYLRYRVTPDSTVVDSAKAKRGKFNFSGSVKYPIKATLRSKDHSISISFYLENAQIRIRGSVDDQGGNFKITGSKTQDEYAILQEATSNISKKWEKLITIYRDALKDKDENKLASVTKKLDVLLKKRRKITQKFIKNHPDSFVSLYKLKKLSNSIDYAPLEKMYNRLNTSIKQSKPGQVLANRIEVLAKTAIGKKAPDFTLNNVKGDPVSLSDFRGQYVLLDFWASWCGPCRVENPNIVAAFNKYKNQGFTVLSVSLDTNRESWLQAIEEDNLTWTQVSDLKGFNSKIVQMYGIRVIPTNYLINPEGVIIEKIYAVKH